MAPSPDLTPVGRCNPPHTPPITSLLEPPCIPSEFQPDLYATGSGSRYLFKLWEITDDILETLRGRDIIAMQEYRNS